MEYTYRRGKILYPDKELTILDRLVIDFISNIEADYVIVSGYVAILFGRGRNTEDIDIFVKKTSYADFSKFYNKIIKSGRYYCINAESDKDAYAILNEKSSIRFAERGTIDPNFEIKFPQNELSLYSLNNAIAVILKDRYKVRIGPIELQLAYKLKLGSEKDYEDAAHLYIIFKDKINKKELKRFLDQLQIKTSLVKKIFRDEI